MKIKPLRDRVWVRKDTPDNMTAGGLHIPDACKDKPTSGTVLAVGPGYVTQDGESVRMELQVGQKVLFKTWDGMNCLIRGEEVFLIPQRDILAVVDG